MGRTKHKTEDERSIMFRLWKNGTSMNRIAKQLNVSRKRVQNAIQKSKQTKAMPEKRGRPRKSSLRQDRLIVKEVKKDPFLTAPRLKELLSNENSLNISTSTVRRRLCDVQLSGRLAKHKPHVSKQNIKKRLAFAKRHKDKDDRWCHNVLWSDELKFNRFSSDGKVYVRRPPNQENYPKYIIKLSNMAVVKFLYGDVFHGSVSVPYIASMAQWIRKCIKVF